MKPFRRKLPIRYLPSLIHDFLVKSFIRCMLSVGLDILFFLIRNFYIEVEYFIQKL